MTELKTKNKKNLNFIALDNARQKALSSKVNKIKKSKKRDAFGSNKSGVIFLKRIPHGFFEPQLRSYFEQFGEVTRLRLSRSKKTGRPKGYAYVEFSCDAVAKVAADTMNNYLMFDKSLKCEVVPSEKVHPKTFVGSNRKFYKPCTRKAAIHRFNDKSTDPSQVEKRERRRKATEGRLKKNLEKLGVDYDITNLATIPDWIEPPRRLRKTSGSEHVVQLPCEPLDVTAEMLVDSDDDEISFKTPPKSSKVSKRSLQPDDKEADLQSPDVPDMETPVEEPSRESSEADAIDEESASETTQATTPKGKRTSKDKSAAERFDEVQRKSPAKQSSCDDEKSGNLDDDEEEPRKRRRKSLGGVRSKSDKTAPSDDEVLSSSRGLSKSAKKESRKSLLKKRRSLLLNKTS